MFTAEPKKGVIKALKVAITKADLLLALVSIRVTRDSSSARHTG